MSLLEIDCQTLNLMIQLQLEDLDDLTDRKGKSCGVSDFEAALDTYRHELAIEESFIYDRSLSESIARAVIIDGDLINTYILEEEQAVHDRDYAWAIGPGKPAHERNDTSQQCPDLEDDYLSKLAALYISPPNEEPESSSSAEERAQLTTAKIRKTMKSECIICGDKHHFFDLATCPCSHE